MSNTDTNTAPGSSGAVYAHAARAHKTEFCADLKATSFMQTACKLQRVLADAASDAEAA